MVIPRIAPFAFLSLLLLSAAAQAGPYRCGDDSLANSEAGCVGHGGLSTNAVCANGYIESGEQCDDGSQNTDIEPDGCRNDCRLAYCGDGVVDSGEQCDGDDLRAHICRDFRQGSNSNLSDAQFWGGSLSCRNDCSFNLSACHYCGDGMTQAPHEQCDDGNGVDDDGCNRDCTLCVPLNANLDITSDTEICTANYDADDYGDLGAIIIKAPNLVLDCDGARLTGHGDGIGIYIKRSDNVTVKNCIIDNYEFGIYAEDSDNIEILGMGNKIYNTTDQVVLDNSTAKPAPPPTVESYGGGLHPNVQSLMGSPLDTRRVPGDSLKLRAMPGALKPPADTSPRQAPRMPGAADDRHEARPVRPSRPVAPAKVTAPVITYPKRGQRFVAPAQVNVKARYDRKQKVVYLLKQLPAKQVIKRSSRPTFSRLGVGRYCVSVAYTGRDQASACVPFSVTKPLLKSEPLRKPITLPR
jgi:cysteine-rich repeat protein/parallel beta-helix repeat protein